ncbi:hypothetical protein N008_20895 [Hymenobacter sp. APR13]|nr:hypothetical protein N008_20895 [Hymenobacter sp. APR13]
MVGLARASYATPPGRGDQYNGSASEAVVAALLAVVKRQPGWGF